MTEAAAAPPVSDAPAPPPVIDAAAPPPAPSPEPKGEAPPADDRSWLPEDMRESADLSRYKSPADLAKAYRNLSNLVGREKVPLPKGDDDTAGWDHLYNALGRPEKPDGYELKAPDKLPDGLVYDEGSAQWFREMAHAEGLTKKQAARMHDLYVQRTAELFEKAVGEQRQAEELALAEADRELKTQWGAAFNHHTIMAEAAGTKLGPPGFWEHAKAQGWNRDPMFMRAFANVGKAIGGLDQLPGGGGQATQTPADLDGEMNKIRGQMLTMTKMSPEYNAAMQRLDVLSRLKHGAT